jgi:iron complex outermembrane receptor protein
LTLAEFRSNPQQIASGTRNGVTVTYDDPNTKVHKEMEHSQIGVVLDHQISESDSLKTMVYYGERSNYQSFVAGSASGYNRDFGGADIKWTHQGKLLEKPLNFTVGVNYDNMQDNRYRYATNTTVGGAILRAQQNQEMK